MGHDPHPLCWRRRPRWHAIGFGREGRKRRRRALRRAGIAERSRNFCYPGEDYSCFRRGRHALVCVRCADGLEVFARYEGRT